jgi:putative pyruvate formate lyase activating enzyme
LWFKDVAWKSVNISIFAEGFNFLMTPLNQQYTYESKDTSILENCILCPRECRVNRFKGATGLNVASVCLHRGEEPLISGTVGICNVFFAGCNMRCVFCQNHDISSHSLLVKKAGNNINSILTQISDILNSGIKSIGFVSPSHMVPQMKAIISGIHNLGFNPVIVYNTNSYDKVETLKTLDGLIDVYLPDLKYISSSLSLSFSSTPDYPHVALKAIKEMYYQKGSSVLTNDEGMAESGILIRHLVLPGQVEESKKVLRAIAEELSPGVHVSLMSQYHPEGNLKDNPELNRTLYSEEYESVVDEMNSLGFRNGYVQEMASHKTFRPDFRREKPFE